MQKKNLVVQIYQKIAYSQHHTKSKRNFELVGIKHSGPKASYERNEHRTDTGIQYWPHNNVTYAR